MLRNVYKAAANIATGGFELLDTCFRVAYGFRFRQAPIVKQNANAIVLGNGPSLRQDFMSLRALAQRGDVDLWCVNFFGNSEEYKLLRPNNYVIADPGHWEDNVTENLKADREEFLSLVDTATRWDVLFHFPYSAKGTAFVSRLEAHPNIKIRFFNHTTVPCRHKRLLFWLYRKELAMPAPQNVLIPAVFLSILSRYDKIFLFGADHSWHVDLEVKDSTVMIRDRHFYDGHVALKPFFKNANETFTMAEIFSTWARVYYQYELLAAFAHHSHVEVLNGSSLTFIDSFKQISINEY